MNTPIPGLIFGLLIGAIASTLFIPKEQGFHRGWHRGVAMGYWMAFFAVVAITGIHYLMTL